MRQNGFRQNHYFPIYKRSENSGLMCSTLERAYKRSQIKKINYKVLGISLITTISIGHVSIQSHLRNWKIKFQNLIT